MNQSDSLIDSYIPPPPEIDLTNTQRSFLTPKRIARISIFVALSAVGAMMKIPSPTGTVALDSCMGYFSAAAFGYPEGALVAALGHLLTAFTTGFPLGLPIHLYIAIQMACWVMAFRFFATRIHLTIGVIVGTLLNGVASAYLIVPFGGIGLAAALVVPLTIGSFVNVAIAAAAYSVVRKSNLV